LRGLLARLVGTINVLADLFGRGFLIAGDQAQRKHAGGGDGQDCTKLFAELVVHMTSMELDIWAGKRCC
jgi:hypothetical protein